MTRRVVVADDQDLVRTGLRVILETNGVEVVGEAADGEEAVALALSCRPDVVLMDVRMPVLDGIEATRRIRDSDDAGPRVLVVTTFDLDEYVFEALRAGASGFLLKDAPRSELLRGIEIVAGGDALLAPSATRRLVEDFARRRANAPPPACDALEVLTPRERHVLELMARGLSNGEIAAELVVGQATVKTHVGHVLTKLGLRDRVQAVIQAYEVGLVQPGDGPLPRGRRARRRPSPRGRSRQFRLQRDDAASRSVHRGRMLQRLGHASAHHPRRTLVVWLIVVVASFVAAPALFSSLTTDMGGGGAASESTRAEERLDELARSLPAPDSATHTGPALIGVVDGLAVDDPATEAAVTRASAAIAALPGVESVLDAYRDPDRSLRATDGQASAVLVTLAFARDDELDRMVDAVQAELERTGAPTVLVGQEDMVGDEIDAQSEEDLVRGETIAMPLAFVALVVVFGGLHAAVLPLALALVSVAGAIILLAMATATGDMAVYSINVVTMFGIGLGIDYGLIVISRFREERALGLPVVAAIERTIATAGRTVGYSGLTVAVALSGLLVFDSSGLRSLALGGIGVVLVAVLAGVSLLPALLALAGRRIRPSRARTRPGAFWHIAAWVRRRAVPVVVFVGIGLIAAAVPFLHARFENPDARSLPRSSVARQLEEVRERFPAAAAAEPIVVVAMATPDNLALAEWVATVEARDDVAAVDVDGFLAPAGASLVEVVPAGSAQGEQAQALVAELRALDAPFETLVTGDVAELVDLKASIAARLPLALGIVGLATMVLLFLMTGSVVVALKAVLMNVLSLGATFGVLVWIFQDGHLSGLLGFDAVGALDATVPLVVFLFAFGLSMDYEVFLLARIKETWDETGDNDVAIAVGLDRTGRIITSAAALLVIVFAGFAAGELVLIKLLGVGMAVAVIVDATIVRTLLVPATMTLMGRWNWWSPAPLRRLHARFGLQETAPAAAVAKPFRPSEPAPSSRF